MLSREFLPSDDAYKLTTRQEHSHSLEDAEKYRAIEELKDVGLFISLASFRDNEDALKVFHGRAREVEEKGAWQVNKWFDNSGNNTGNANVNKVPSLAVGSFDVAKQFAEARGWRKSDKQEIHEIISNDPEAVIIDGRFFDKLKKLPLERQQLIGRLVSKNLKVLTENLSFGRKVPVSFEERNIFNKYNWSDFSLPNKPLLNKQDIVSLATKLKLPVELTQKIASLQNTTNLLNRQPDYLTELFIKGIDTVDSVPINLDYIAQWLREAHVVGVNLPIYSATLGKRTEATYLFDLDRVNTKPVTMKQRGETFRKYQEIINRAGDLLPVGEKQAEPMLSLLTNQLYAKPEQLVEEASRVANFRQNYEADAGNWEGFSLGEHTETVLRVFDENYADRLPVELLPIMRLVLLTHDLGKPQAVADGKKEEQLTYNLKEAVHFCVKAGISKQLGFLVYAILSAEPYTFAFFMERIKGNDQSSSYKQAEQAFLDYCADQFKWLGDRSKPTDKEIRGLANMCLILQVCDSAAYTSMAVVRSAKTGGYYDGSSSFNKSFKRPNSVLNKRKVSPKGF